MCQNKTYDQSSHQRIDEPIPLDKSIGDLFRDFGEKYIEIYKPDIHKIKLIRSIRLCKTPALGGRAICCKACGHNQIIYLSCGHSQCPLCQYNKRQKWKDKLCSKLLKTSYTHTVFTIPHQLNKLSKKNPKQFYNIIMRSSWACIKELTAKKENLGGLPGMISVLHTFGSDMKYHLHVHSLITFGGVDEEGKWHWPKRKNKLARYREISSTFRRIFLDKLNEELRTGKIIALVNTEQTLKIVCQLRWNVRNSPPTINTNVLENYLARYINRIAISKSRFEYLAHQKLVNIIFKDYRNKEEGKPVPLKIKAIQPLVAIDQFLMHLLPPYFQKSRYYGLHASATLRKFKDKIDNKLLRNGDSIKQLFRLLKSLIKTKPYVCKKCNHDQFEIIPIKRNPNWIFYFITLPALRAPPIKIRHIKIKLA